MNTYKDGTIVLTSDAEKRFLTTLLTDKESSMLRDRFVAEVQQTITFLDDGKIVVDIPELEI